MSGRQTPAADGSQQSSAAVTPEIAAEAAVWIARLHGPDRSRRMERECLEWQGRSAAHRLAFERCTETWQDVSRITLGDAFAAMSFRGSEPEAVGKAPRAKTSRRLFAICASMAVLACGVGLQLWRSAGVYSTGVGEQRLVVLEDGSRMSLNTDSRVRVRLDASRRSVEVLGGETLFEVAKDAARPFVVRAADSEVVAIGTAFSVRLEPASAGGGDTLAVTLIEGQVKVRAIAQAAPVEPQSSWMLTMKAGDRVRRVVSVPARSDTSSNVQLDRPRIEAVLAWRRNEAVFDNISLADAVAEMNRYNRTKIVLVGTVSSSPLRVSGVYRTGDTAGFARDVAALHGLVVLERDGRLELAKPQ